MHTTLISLLSYIGTASSIIEGILTAKKMKLQCFIQFLSGISAAFLGEIFLRDLVLLRTTPACFANPLAMTITATACVFSIIILKNKEPENICPSILCIFNSIGIVGSVAVGYNQGARAGVLTAFACGFVTSCGGSILTTAIQTVTKNNCKTFFITLAENKWHYLFIASMSIIYGILNFTNHNDNAAIIILVAVAIVIGFIVE